MKIAFIGQKGIPVSTGGVERRVDELATKMVEKGHEVFVYVRDSYTPKNLNEYKGVRLIHVPAILTKNLSAITHTFLSSLHALFQDYDVIHYQAPGPSSLCWIIKFFKPATLLVATFNSRDSKHQKWGFFARKYLDLGEFIISKIPDKTIVVSEILRDYVKEKFNCDAVVIHNGSSNTKIDDTKLIDKWGLKNGEYFLSVSRLIKHKGIHYLIEAFNQGQAEGKIPSNFKLVIVGEGSFTDQYVKYIQEMAGDNQNIIFTGNETGDELASLYSNALTFVLPSEAEGLSNSLLEAMAYGLAPIVSDISENVYPLAGHGIIFKNKDIEDLKSKLCFAVENKEKLVEIGKQAKDQVEKNYSWQINVEKTLLLYEELLKEKNKKCLKIQSKA